MERAQILEEISKMTVLELSQLIKDMEEKFGVSAAAATVVAAAHRLFQLSAARTARRHRRAATEAEQLGQGAVPGKVRTEGPEQPEERAIRRATVGERS